MPSLLTSKYAVADEAYIGQRLVAVFWESEEKGFEEGISNRFVICAVRCVCSNRNGSLKVRFDIMAPVFADRCYDHYISKDCVAKQKKLEK